MRKEAKHTLCANPNVRMDRHARVSTLEPELGENEKLSKQKKEKRRRNISDKLCNRKEPGARRPAFLLLSQLSPCSAKSSWLHMAGRARARCRRTNPLTCSSYSAHILTASYLCSGLYVQLSSESAPGARELLSHSRRPERTTHARRAAGLVMNGKNITRNRKQKTSN